MKFYYPTDKNGNKIGFKTPESLVYDASGKSLTDKLSGKMDTGSSEYIKALSISGKTITYTKGDGSTGTLITQDTSYTLSSFGITATAAELNYVDGVTSNIQTQLNGKAASDHTHKYAGSSTVGGSANSAVKLDSSAGSETQPVYFSGGKPVATTYTLGKSVPSDAKFTDTTYSAFVKSGSGAKAGLVPAPSTTAGTTKYLREDGTWQVPPDTNTTYTLSSFGINATATELNYVKGVTSAIQTQLNGKAATSHGTHVSYDTAAPKAAGTASAGSAATVSRSDHVHPLQTSVSGNAGTATAAYDTTPGTASLKNIQASTTDLVNGQSTLATGTVYLVYKTS